MVSERNAAYHLLSILVVGDQRGIAVNRELLASVVFPLRLRASQPIVVVMPNCYCRLVGGWSLFVMVECVRQRLPFKSSCSIHCDGVCVTLTSREGGSNGCVRTAELLFGAGV